MPDTVKRIAVAAAGLALVAGCSSPGPGADQNSNPPPQTTPTSTDAAPASLEGVTLNVALANQPFSDQLQAAVPEFEELTGANVELSIYADEQLAQLFNVKMNAKSDEIDVLMYRPLQDTLLMNKNGWLADLADRVTAAGPEWDWDDFIQASRDSVMVDGKVVGVPTGTETGVLYYRTDLLEEIGKPVPTTLDELAEDVKLIHDLHPDIYAFAGRGEKSAAVTQFSSFLYNFGGNWVDADGKAAIDTPEAIEALNYYGGLLRDYGPPGSTDMNWPQVMGLLQQGLVAFYPEGSSQYNGTVDPTKSTVIGKIGVAPIPAGPAGEHPYNITNFALGVSQFSTQQDAAWQFVQWATSKANVLKFQQNNVAGARTSVWNDPTGTASLAPDLLAAIQHNGPIGVGYDRPLLISVAEAREIVGVPIVTAIQGGDVAAAAAEANPKFQALLDQDGV